MSESVPTADVDVLIVGGGIAGATLGARVAGKRRTMIVEAESQCGYHATGRSAAFWLESYGGPVVAQLTKASLEPLRSAGHLRQRGALHLSRDRHTDVPDVPGGRHAGRKELERLLPGLRPQWRSALVEPGCFDIDVAALHASALTAFRRAGGELRTQARLLSADHSNGSWRCRFADRSECRTGVLVDAAGAWADDIAAACGVPPIGIAPKRRTMVQLRVGRAGLRDLPLVDDVAGTFYFKGEGDRSLWLTPHDEIDSAPCDAAPDELQVARAIDRFQQVVDWPVERVERTWAGLRSFAADRLPVYGFDPAAPRFFWCAGQGGFGIQTAPAAARMAAALLLGEEPDERIAAIDPRDFSPARFR